MANRFANKYQFGIETTSGTAVAADTLVLGAEIQALDPDRVPVFHEDNLGVRARSSRVTFGNYLFEHSLNIEHGYFQILPTIFSCGLKGGVSPAEQTGSQNDYLWDNSPALTGDNGVDSFTLELGDDTQAYEAEYCQLQNITLGCQIAQAAEHSPVNINTELYGRQVSPVSFTGGVSVPTVTGINGKLSRIYVDADWASLGGSELTSFLRGWELEIMTGMHPKFFGSSNSYFDSVGQGHIEFMLTLTMERGSNSDTQWDTWRAGTEKAVRIQIDSGVQIGSGDNHTLTLDMWGAFEHVTPFDNEDRGNNVDVALFRGMYDESAGDLIDVKTITNVSAI